MAKIELTIELKRPWYYHLVMFACKISPAFGMKYLRKAKLSSIVINGKEEGSVTLGTCLDQIKNEQ